MEKKIFGKINGQEVYLYTLKNSKIEVEITNYGATIVAIKVADKVGNPLDVVLGYDKLESYVQGDKYLGATVGRSANRISKGLVKIDGKVQQLSQNDGENHIHGGFVGFDKKIWHVEEIPNGIKCSYLSKNGEEGYLGNLLVEVFYTLEDEGLRINYRATSDEDTIFNPTNHSYFNLDGSQNILEHNLKINADFYTENDNNSLTTGEIVSVENTPMNFRKFKKIGEDIEDNYEQIIFGKGFDNNWVVKDYDGKIKQIAEAYSEKSKIKLEVLSDFMGIQFYTGNYLDGSLKGKRGFSNDFRSGFCLECQYFPNSFANENFEKPILRKDEEFSKTIIYRFSKVD